MPPEGKCVATIGRISQLKHAAMGGGLAAGFTLAAGKAVVDEARRRGRVLRPWLASAPATARTHWRKLAARAIGVVAMHYVAQRCFDIETRWYHLCASLAVGLTRKLSKDPSGTPKAA